MRITTRAWLILRNPRLEQDERAAKFSRNIICVIFRTNNCCSDNYSQTPLISYCYPTVSFFSYAALPAELSWISMQACLLLLIRWFIAFSAKLISKTLNLSIEASACDERKMFDARLSLLVFVLCFFFWKKRQLSSLMMRILMSSWEEVKNVFIASRLPHSMDGEIWVKQAGVLSS